MYNYCTLFDSFYLSRAITMYESLVKESSNFHLYIFAFDEQCYTILKELSLNNITVISLNELEDETLLELKSTRTKGEYCWTCTPSTIKYCIERYNLKHCTYIDADLYFFSNPNILVDELPEEKDVSIIEHRYTPKYDQTKTSGKYCVQFMTFKNTKKGMEVLNWWRNACNEWCYARIEDKKFGDQKYLDDWMERFDCVYELQHLGGGVAPWNMQQYFFYKNYDKVKLKETGQEHECIFFHFHNFKLIDKELFALTNYQLSDDCRNTIYTHYTKHIYKVNEELLEKYQFSLFEYKLYKNFYMIYCKDIESYLHA